MKPFKLEIFYYLDLVILLHSTVIQKGGEILLYIQEDISSNLLTIEKKPIEGFYVELNLNKNKWFVNCSYNPHKISIDYHQLTLNGSLHAYSSTSEKIVILGYFNAGTEDNYMKLSCENYNLKSLIKQPTCYKNPDNSACINLNTNKCSSEFAKHMCFENRTIRFSFDDTNSNEKMVLKMSTKGNTLQALQIK